MKQPATQLRKLDHYHRLLPTKAADVVRKTMFMIALLGCNGMFVSASRTWGQGTSEQPSEASMAMYADAANFQTGGALKLAIESWNKFLTKHPSHPMAADAAHFLGVCYMQSDPPDYVAAGRSFANALKNKKYDLREESLVNYGWCLYATAGDGQEKDPKRLTATIASFRTLVKEFPKSQFLDRAFFYSGEAAYGLGQPQPAVDFYNQLLALPDAAKSPLHCDAIYARGVAYEELKLPEQAVASFKQLLASCSRDELIADVHLRMGDLLIQLGKYDQAVTSFQSLRKTDASEDDLAYALFRQAYAFVQSGQPSKAAETYEQLRAQFPDSTYATSAILASAQSSYRGGDMPTAETKFLDVLAQGNMPAATEASHWLARIYLAKGDSEQAITVTRKQLDRGVEGEFANDLRLDLAEALAAQPNTVEESLKLFEKIYRDAPTDELAPRALYNAAFSALQLGQSERALKLALEFVKTFPKDTLVSDLRFVAGESQLATGQAALASDTFAYLLSSSDRDNVQRPVWVLRAAVANNAAKKWDQTISMLRKEIPALPEPDQQAEAYQLIGQAHLRAGRGKEAAKAFQKSLQAGPDWSRSDQTSLLLGQALLAANQAKDAQGVWRKMIDDARNPVMADQARYRVAQLATADNRFEDAIKWYDQILKPSGEPRLVPYAQYGKGWAELQLERYQPAFETLDQMLTENQQHPLRNDATLARGIASRNLGQFTTAKADLELFLASKPNGINLGHSLYELALIDQQSKQPAEAAKKLERLVKEVPDYPSMDQVLYELGWSLQESGDVKAAIRYFETLIDDFPKNPLVAEAAYFIGQQNYAEKQWEQAAKFFAIAAARPGDATLNEKAHYRMGWSYFNLGDYENSEQAFSDQSARHSNGAFAFDAEMMVGESRFKRKDYKTSLSAYQKARAWIRDKNETSQTIRDASERQIRELAFLHGGQSAAQLKQWDEAIKWYDELRERFPTTAYLPQAFYETGFAYQQQGDPTNAMRFYAQVADKYRNELAARARFMMGEIHFSNKAFDKAIPEFQRVMFGFGAEKAPDQIKNWQAKSGFEAARCSELLMQSARSDAAKNKARNFVREFYSYVIEKHPKHELASDARKRLEALK
ncbi:MAG: tetratricopeptide repeat protein [Rubripirellula sp.]|nr:tetratricopeptide repeat protein [Rubripirellula sp.]